MSFSPCGSTPITGVGSPFDPMTRSPTVSEPMGRKPSGVSTGVSVGWHLPRMYARGAISMVPAAIRLGMGWGVGRVWRGVGEGAGVGVDLPVRGAGKKAEPLPRLYRGPGQDDPVD